MSRYPLSFSNYALPTIVSFEFDGSLYGLKDFNSVFKNPLIQACLQFFTSIFLFYFDKKIKGRGSWIFNTSNFYNRKNVSFYFVEDDKVKGATLLPIVLLVTSNYIFQSKVSSIEHTESRYSGSVTE